MPEISRFYGIIVSMFYDEHNPPHFHARYGEYKIAIDVNSLQILEGKFPPRALGLIMEWASLYKNELLKDWEITAQNLPPGKIEPLK
ncbi:MAG: DUF4160 domain-containing protein [Candidatus Desantisbacteria bacterium]